MSCCSALQAILYMVCVSHIKFDDVYESILHTENRYADFNYYENHD